MISLILCPIEFFKSFGFIVNRCSSSCTKTSIVLPQVQGLYQVESQTVDIDSTLSFDISIPNSVLDYKYQEAEYETVSDSTWYKPWTWGNTIEVLVQEEEHLFTINPIDILIQF
jgi:hypothetical protein